MRMLSENIIQIASILIRRQMSDDTIQTASIGQINIVETYTSQ